jgi:predicted ArsR family transcriptional regulator
LDGSPGDGDETTTKVVLMELARASGPLPAAALAERTLLSTEAVESALQELVAADLCTVLSGDERRPRRYETAVEVDPRA